MSREEFWEMDPYLAPAYREAFDIRRQRKSEEMWLMGAYNFRAFMTGLSNFHMDGKRHKFNEYPADVVRVIPYSEEEKAAIAEKERQKTIAYFNRLAQTHKGP